ncbi:MAG TPA: HPr(Ser) kinase/phosphatase [Firmicutes bacterium]|nr:HPr(Ser) kinase/phosphatase [Bacillota bacterium]
MPSVFSVSIAKIIKEIRLQEVYLPRTAEEIMISSRDINRPGIEISGFFDYFDEKRIQILGRAEVALLKEMEPERRLEILEAFFSRKPAVVILSRNLDVPEGMLEAAKKYGIAILRSADTTTELVGALVSYLNVELAPRITRHGVLVEVLGEGILLVGDSGVGKSETAIELIKRGHRLIADDAVEIRRVSSHSLVGTAPENIRHFIELRGIGIINARRIFGMGAVKLTEKIDMAINLEIWDSSKVYDRMGIDNEYTEILGVQVPVLTIPVKPGRNLAIIIEVAAMNNRQKKMGYNAAQELLANLGMDVSAESVGNTRELKL